MRFFVVVVLLFFGFFPSIRACLLGLIFCFFSTVAPFLLRIVSHCMELAGKPPIPCQLRRAKLIWTSTPIPPAFPRCGQVPFPLSLAALETIMHIFQRCHWKMR